jgi:PHD/YefM family antitoxin component YafN of YafNO toxin-antitoxin module
MGARGTRRTVWSKLKRMEHREIQYVSDENGQPVGVIVPIDLWRELESERETAHLLKSEAMKRRLLEAKNRQTGVPIENALEKLGI